MSQKKKRQQQLERALMRALDGLTNVEAIVRPEGVRRYVGEPKIKIPNRWPHRRLLVLVCETSGQKEVCICTSKPGAIARLVRKRLAAEGVPVC